MYEINFQASTVISPWAPGYNVVGEKLKRNTTTNQVSERSVTTACASNLGDIKVKDIDGVINRGKKVKLLTKYKLKHRLKQFFNILEFLYVSLLSFF